MNRTEYEHDSELERALAALAVEREPCTDLWPAIAQRLQHSGGTLPVSRHATPGAGRSRWTRSRLRGALLSLAACAGLVLAVLLALPGRVPPFEMRAGAHPFDHLLLREADALEREYAAAFAQFEHMPVPEPLAPGLDALVLESARVRAALQRQPQQTRLLEELQNLHERRLRLLKRGLELIA